MDPITTGAVRNIVSVQDIDDAQYFEFEIEKKQDSTYTWWQGYMITPDYYCLGTPAPYGNIKITTKEYTPSADYDFKHPSYGLNLYIWKSVEGYPSTIYPFITYEIFGKFESLFAPLSALNNGNDLKTLFGVSISKLQEGEKEENHPAYLRLIDHTY